jgi:hypothetical protein
MNKLKRELTGFGFSKQGEIISPKSVKFPFFELRLNAQFDYFEGIVYMWVIEENGSPKNILYVGGSGETIDKRCKQHQAGFKHSPRGRIIGAEIGRLLENGKKNRHLCSHV